MKKRQEKAKKEQKIVAVVMAGLVIIFTYMFMRDNIWWIMIAVTYAAVVIAVIFYELIDEAWARARIEDYDNSISYEPLTGLRTETATIDTIS